MIQVNFSIFLSFFSILLIVIAKIINEFEKFVHQNKYFSVIDPIIFGLAILGSISASIMFFYQLKRRTQKDNEICEDGENDSNQTDKNENERE